MKYSIIVGYKDIDIQRVDYFIKCLNNQTFKDFEIIFVDYFSKIENKQKLKELFEKFNLNIKLVSLPSANKIWSRAHCLNIGADNSINEYLIFTDIDILFEVDFFSKINQKLSFTENSVFYYKCRYLDKNFDYDSLINPNPNYDYINKKAYKISTKVEKGLSIIPNKLFKEINGFDELYRIWGFEDLDLFQRLENLNNCKITNLSENEFMTYHKWHPPSKKDKYLPVDWINFMRQYMYENKKNIIRNRIYSEFYNSNIESKFSFIDINLKSNSPSSVYFQLLNIFRVNKTGFLKIHFKLSRSKFVLLLDKFGIKHVNSSIQYYYESFFYFIFNNEKNWINYEFFFNEDTIELIVKL